MLLDLVSEAGLRWGLRVHAVALMPNHFHLLVEDREGLLSRGMRHVLGVYTQRFNKLYETDGALFRGRFRSRLVQTEEYLAELVRYIHLNPVRAGLVAVAGAYPWSSHRHYLDPSAHAPEWLHTDEVFRRFGGDNPKGRAELDGFVHLPVDAEVAALLHHEPWRPLLGTPEFVGRWRQALRRASPTGSEEVPDRRRLLALTVDEVLCAVADHYDVEHSELLEARRGRGRRSVPRAMALVLLVDRTRLTHLQVAEVLAMRPSSVGSLAGRHRAAVLASLALSDDLQAIEGRLTQS